jgi:hypothetical protein
VLGCLMPLALWILVALAVTAFAGNILLGFISGGFAAIGYTLVMYRLATLRHHRLMREWAVERGVTNLTFATPKGAITPPEMPWWMNWAAYEIQGTDEHGKRLHFHIFVTGAVDCLFRLRMNVTTENDYISLTADDFGGRPLHTVPADEVLRVLEEKRRKSDH